MKIFWIYPAVILLCWGGWNCAFAAEALVGDPFAEHSPPASLPGDPFAEDPAVSSLPGDPFAENDADRDGAAAKDLEQSENMFLQKGWLESRNQFWCRNGRAFSARQRLWLEGGTAFTLGAASEDDGPGPATARIFFSGSVDYDAAAADLSSDHDELSAMLHEVYLSVEGKSVDLALGKKMVRWGTGDGVNPVDLINPQDHRDPLASGRSDNRLAVFLLQGIISLPVPEPVQELTLEVVAVPLAEVSTLNAAGSAWEPLALQNIRAAEQQGLLSLADQEKPERWLKDGKYGLRLAATAGGWDLGLTTYSGVKNVPVFTGELDANSRLRITPVHPRISAYGVSFAKGIHRSTLRGELAVKPRYPMQKEETLLPGYSRRSLIEGVVGFDRTFALNRYLNLQYFAEYIPEDNGLTGRGYSDGLTFECSDLFFNDDLKLGVSGVVGFSGQGWAVQPYGEYHIGDNWLLAASCFLFHGDESERYGQFADRDFVSLRLRYSF